MYRGQASPSRGRYGLRRAPVLGREHVAMLSQCGAAGPGYTSGPNVPMSRLLRVLSALLAGALGLVLIGEAPARAYPQWQLSSGAVRCNQCHYAPAGGGLLTSYGRDAAGDQLSTFGGNGEFLHGAVALPSWFALGGDFRGAFVANDVQAPNGPTVAVFPMQADLYARVALPAGFSLNATGGFRGQVRNPDLAVPAQDYQPVSTSELISREHYAMWEPSALGPYVRAGRFFTPFGLRFAEHNFYIRRDLGLDQLEETYNVSGGFIYDAWELHVSLFAPDFVRHIGSNEQGVAALFAGRLADDHVELAAQTRLAVGPGVTRFIFGGYGKLYVERLRSLLFAEVDGVQLLFNDPSVGSRGQVIGLAGFTVLPIPGVMLTLLGERNQIDVAFNDAWTAADALINWFPYAHVEAQVVGRLQFPTGGEVAKTLFIQLHYFL